MGVQTLTPHAEEVAVEAHRIITILSPKGGAGKSTAATNLAVGLAQRHPREVVLVDIDLQFGDVASMLRLEPKATIVDVARRWPVDSANLKLALTSHRSGLFTLCAPMNPAEADEINAEHVAGIISALHRSFKYVIIDTDPGLSERVLSALDLSTDIVMVCATEVPSITGLRKALTALDVVGLVSANRRFLLNRANAKTGVDIQEVERAIGHRVDIRVPSSLDMVLACNDGVPIMESEKNPEIVKAFTELVALFEEPVEGSGAGNGGRRLFKRKA